MTLRDELNPQQLEAVLATEGPVMVLAGAGTGKTRVITYRIAHLVESGVQGASILGVTFTNKAADQMKERVRALLRPSGHDSSEIWISTFHSFCARLLRREASKLGLPNDFAIYDDSDQAEVMKVVMDRLELGDSGYTPRQLLSRISYAKNFNLSPEEMAAEVQHDAAREMADVFAAYENALHEANALDFDDLLLRAVDLLRDHPDVRAAWSDRFHYILVDEFQDTNQCQEDLIRLLAGSRKNVCVVGDEDQSIYSWRGAKAGNFQRFLNDFPGTKVFRLEENYRSTQKILDAAAGLVANNANRLGKTLRATRETGCQLRFFEAQDAPAEANFICNEIAWLVRPDASLRIAVLYRTAAQSRSFEEVLREMGIRFRVVGGFSFYKRAEVKVALSYVRLLFHPQDDVALLRVINTPPRGIGKVALDSLRGDAQARGVSLWEALRAGGNSTTARGSRALQAFRELMDDMRDRLTDLLPAEMMRGLLDQTGYLDWIEEQDRLERSSRAENLRELVNAMADASEQGETLQTLLDYAALVGDADEYDENVPVSLMTLHSAKGLEFDYVFLAGLEEGLLPHSRSKQRPEDIEEERRLCYVGMTRAKQGLVLTRALQRRNYGEERLRESVASRFLREVPGELVETAAGSLSEPGETRRYTPVEEFAQSRSYRGRRGGGSVPGRATGRPQDSLIGARVHHPTFGIGTILRIEGEEDDRLLTVSFLDYGTKKMKERFANLKLA